MLTELYFPYKYEIWIFSSKQKFHIFFKDVHLHFAPDLQSN